MIGMRKFLCILTAVMLATFALSSVADNGKKIYNLDVSVAQQTNNPPTAPFTLTATLMNVSAGNSSFKSFKLFVGGLNVLSASTDNGTVSSFTASSVSVVNMFPVKPGAAVQV